MSINASLIPSGILNGTIFPVPSSGPSAEDVFSAEGVDEITITGTPTSMKANVKKFVLPDATEIVASLFQSDTNVEEVDAPNAVSVDNLAFAGASKLNKVVLPKVETLNNNVFNNAVALKKIELPELTTINYSSFSSAYAEEIYAPKLNTVSQNNFNGAKKLKKLTVGNNLTISSSVNTQKAFYEMGKDVAKGSSEIDLEVTWSTYNSSNHRNIFQYMTVRSLTVKELSTLNESSNFNFQNMKAESISFPDLVSLNGSSSTFSSCQVDSISFPKLETLGSGSFRNMVLPADYNLTLPKVKAIPTNTFYATTGINSLTLPECTEITGSSYNLTLPSQMKHLYLPGSTMCAITATPDLIFGNTFLSADDTAVHVPSDLLASYTVATNWADMSTKLIGDLPAVNNNAE